MVKNCDLGLENAALGLRPRAAFSRPRSQFFTIRTSQPANNIYIFHHDAMHITRTYWYMLHSSQGVGNLLRFPCYF